MIDQMSKRERFLAMLVGITVVFVLSFAIFKMVSKNYRQLRDRIANRTADLDGMKALMVERELWVQRDAWLNSKQPALTNPGGAGVKLLEDTKVVADKYTVVIKNQAIESVDTKAAAYQAASIRFKTSSDWKDLIKFMHEVQSPENFVVFERATLKLDDADKSKAAGDFHLAKWYAPAGAPR